MTDIIKAVIIGIIEGITEWLPVSSTGHMILTDNFILKDPSLLLNSDDAFKKIFLVVIQLGAIFAVITLFWKRLWPFHSKKAIVIPYFKTEQKKGIFFSFCNNFVYVDRFILWFKILLASLPAAVLGIAFDEQIDAMLTGDTRILVISCALIFYGILFIVVENLKIKSTITDTDCLTYKAAFFIGLIQCLSLVPGTSRSGVTILGAILLGLSRSAAADFSFFLSVPAMVGGSLMEILKYVSEGNDFNGQKLAILFVGMVTAFIVSLITIKLLLAYIRKHDFKIFGYYRIVLGIILILLILFGIK